MRGPSKAPFARRRTALQTAVSQRSQSERKPSEGYAGEQAACAAGVRFAESGHKSGRLFLTYGSHESAFMASLAPFVLKQVT